MSEREITEQKLQETVNLEIVDFIRENRDKIIERALIRLKKIASEIKATQEESAQNEEKLR